MSHFCSSNADVSATAPSTTFKKELSIYSPISFASNDDVAGAISDGFRTKALPAAIAPTTGSRDNTAHNLKNLVPFFRQYCRRVEDLAVFCRVQIENHKGSIMWNSLALQMQTAKHLTYR